MPQDTKVKQLIVNQLSKEQYKQAKLDNILSDTEIYIITDDYHYTELEIQTLLATKQDKLIASGKINIDENNIISVDLSDYDSTLGSSLEYKNSVLTLVSKNGKTLSNVTIKSTPDVDDTTIHLNNSEQLEVIGNITKDGTTKYDWIGTKEEYEQGLTSGLITSTTACYITNDEIDLISGTDISLPTKLSELSNDTNFVNNETLNNSIATKVDKVEGKSLISDTEIIRLSGVTNYNDTQIKQDLLNKVDKVEGKSLIDDTEIVRLNGVTNYDDTSVVNNITDLQINKSNTSLNNLTPEGEKHFLNKQQITNCILEAPNGVATYSGDTITIKQGLKVLMPDGLNSDGTLKNIEYTLENDANVVRGQLKKQISIFLKSDGTANDANYYFVVNDYSDITTNLGLYYVINENNIYYRNSQGSISKVTCAYIGDATTDGTTITSNITSLITQQPINLLTMSNKNIISGWGMPSNRYITLTTGASGVQYIAPANGWFAVRIIATSAGSSWGLITNSSIGTIQGLDLSRSGAVFRGLLPVKKGNVVKVDFGSATFDSITFYYAESEV